MTTCVRAQSTHRPCRGWIAVAGIVSALLVLLGFAAAASAAEYRYRLVDVTKRSVTFAVDDLAGQTVISARLTAAGRNSRRIDAAKVDRAARTKTGLLRLRLPRSWRPARRASRLQIRLGVRARSATVPTAGTVLWRADAEASMSSEWASNSSLPTAASPPSPDVSRIAQSPFRAQGRSAYRFEMRDGDESYGERAELGQALPARAGDERRWFRAGEERWIAMQYYLPASWPTDDTWQTVLQIKPVSPGGGGPVIGLDAGGDRLEFYGNSNDWGSTAGNKFYGDGPRPGRGYSLPRRRWIKLTWHIVFSADPSAGSIEAFGDLGDGKGMRTLVPLRTTATMKYNGSEMDPVHLRVGIYRDPALTATEHLYVDGITVATTRASAEANAYGAAATAPARPPSLAAVFGRLLALSWG